VLDQGGQKGLRYKRALMQIGRIYTGNRIWGLYGIARENRRKKEKCKKKDQEPEQGRTRIS
jgi:hypothetical protein